MNNEVIFFITIIGYIGIGYFIPKLIRKRIINMNQFLKMAILSFTYALIFGIGLIGGGGYPGFALPCPVIVSALFDILDWIPFMIFINGVIIPLAFWWILILVIMLIRHKIKKILIKNKH